MRTEIDGVGRAPGQWIPIAIVLAALSSVTGAGCATNPAASAAPGLTIEKVASREVVVDSVRTENRSDGIRVYGSASRRISRRGAVPGQVNLAIMSPDGRVLSETQASLMRRNRQAQSARFNALLPVEAPPGSVLRVTALPDPCCSF
ncbi:hypothetical protein G3480_19955 [Thiorhodococcus mannitoliphagus]|uniref:Uncharacterized protein n=1 Tax=Thiorhodococcus mannitoliphagus TaxID=329406 RepID=A0A6P1DZU4_9GAMM|nr:hypothetical protein [Thiorhodococcus mannitoliphagus]NEX22551.1 hypothetical protein [Thiorhodococcus mannitoliphagus]